MEFIFVKTQELKEFEQELKQAIRFFRYNAIKIILLGLFTYMLLVFMLILLP